MGTAPALDVRCQCTGFLYALNVGQLFVASGHLCRVMVVGVEIHSRGVEFATQARRGGSFWRWRGCGDFGTGRVRDQGFLSIHLHAEGKYADKLWVDARYGAFTNDDY